MEVITRDELQSWIDKGRAFTLLDVLPAAAHETWRIPGSRHACIYETSFPEQVEKAGVPKDQPVVVYCAGPRSAGSADAAEALAELGYGEVHRFEGGRAAWSEAGLPAEGEAAERPWSVEEPPPADGRYTVDTERSVLQWTGRNAGNSHYGTIPLSGGYLTIREGVLAEGEAIADMTKIQVDDLEGEMAQMLIQHLATADFFLVPRYPTATFRLDGSEPVPGAAPGQINASLRGTMEIRGTTHPLSFAAAVSPQGEETVGVHGTFQFDRTRWGSRYGSGKIYQCLGPHLVHDTITITVRLVATR